MTKKGLCRRMSTHIIPLLLALFLTIAAGAETPKHRLIVLTDIGGDPDDQQSFVRLLLYANEYDIEALIATSTRSTVNTVQIHERLEAYRKVYANLAKHAKGYPTTDKLLAMVKTGCQERFMKNVGKDKSTEASRHIISVVDRDDPRPVWVTVWGAATDLAQALWDVQNSRTPEQTEAFVEKLRVYDIAGQDDSGAWICHTFPDIFYIRSVMQFQAISVRESRPFPPEVTGANIETFTTQWVDEHIQSHGPLGALYPERKYKYEGDTPAFLYLLPNGLSDPEQVHQGNWGGRFDPVKVRNAGAFSKKYAEAQKEFRDFKMYTEAADTWSWGKHTYTDSRFASLFRWREAFQNDFAARMDWSVSKLYEDANHNPIAVLSGDKTKDILNLTVKGGETVRLSAVGSSDPDGDELEFRWMHYKEAGTHEGDIALDNPKAERVQFRAPNVYGPETIHIVLTVKDRGKPALYAYRRVIVTVNLY